MDEITDAPPKKKQPTKKPTAETKKETAAPTVAEVAEEVVETTEEPTILNQSPASSIVEDKEAGAENMVNDKLVTLEPTEAVEQITDPPAEVEATSEPTKAAVEEQAGAGDCDPAVDCNGRGACVNGSCVCDSKWTGSSCELDICSQRLDCTTCLATSQVNCAWDSTSKTCTQGDENYAMSVYTCGLNSVEAFLPAITLAFVGLVVAV